jgi:hypothetical protein
MIRPAILTVLGTVLLWGSTASAQVPRPFSQPHLRGITGVNLRVTVDPRLDGARAIEQALRQVAVQALEAGRLRPTSPEAITLQIEVMVHPPEDLTSRTQVTVVRVRVQLRQAARLVRDARLTMSRPNEAVTWADTWLVVAPSREPVGPLLLRTRASVEMFAIDAAFENQSEGRR